MTQIIKVKFLTGVRISCFITTSRLFLPSESYPVSAEATYPRNKEAEYECIYL